MDAIDNALRLSYLQALGITVWEPRQVAEMARQAVVTQESVVAAADTTDWLALQAEVASCTRCGLCKTRQHTVFGSGNAAADWLLIGEGPGQHEDEQGLPFVGKAGLLLTEMIRALGKSRDEVYITNIVKCRPPGNREPHADEVAACHRFLERQIALIRPQIILAVGRVAAQTLLDTDTPVSKLRGKVHQLKDMPLVVVYHPAYLLRSLLEKRKAWEDLQFALRVAARVG